MSTVYIALFGIERFRTCPYPYATEVHSRSRAASSAEGGAKPIQGVQHSRITTQTHNNRVSTSLPDSSALSFINNTPVAIAFTSSRYSHFLIQFPLPPPLSNSGHARPSNYACSHSCAHPPRGCACSRRPCPSRRSWRPRGACSCARCRLLPRWTER